LLSHGTTGINQREESPFEDIPEKAHANAAKHKVYNGITERHVALELVVEERGDQKTNENALDAVEVVAVVHVAPKLVVATGKKETAKAAGNAKGKAKKHVLGFKSVNPEHVEGAVGHEARYKNNESVRHGKYALAEAEARQLVFHLLIL